MRLQQHQNDPEKEWLIIGGEDHKTGRDRHIESKYERLEAWAKERFPLNEISFRWSGQVLTGPVNSCLPPYLGGLHERKAD